MFSRIIHDIFTDNKNASSSVMQSDISDTSQTQKHQQSDYYQLNLYEMQEQLISATSTTTYHSQKRSQLNFINNVQEISSASVDEQDNFTSSLSSSTSLNSKEKLNIKKNAY